QEADAHPETARQARRSLGELALADRARRIERERDLALQDRARSQDPAARALQPGLERPTPAAGPRGLPPRSPPALPCSEPRPPCRPRAPRWASPSSCSRG